MSAAPRGRYASLGKAGELRKSPTTLGILEHEGNSGEGAESKPPWASGLLKERGFQPPLFKQELETSPPGLKVTIGAPGLRFDL